VTRRTERRLLGGAGIATALGGVSALLARGALTVDLGIGRSLRPLGPLSWQIEAPPEVVFDVIAAPYLERTPRALQSKLRVIERGADMVLAEHFTEVGRLVATTLETVRFERPHRVSFRLVRGPVPHVAEQFLLRETETGTELEYSGELGADLWALGRWWGERVARRWEAAVRSSLDAVKGEAERRAARGQPGAVHRAPSARFEP
jgi:Polyketide cyclase / dehydrase and lipid transport